MKICFKGTSRIVLIQKEIVIKFPFFNIVKIISIILKDKTRIKESKSFHKNFIFAVLLYFFHSLTANRREYLYFKKHKEEENLLPLKGLLGGYIIIQPKGDVFNHHDSRWKIFLKKIKERGVRDIDLLKPHNFCTWRGRIKLLDYGSVMTQEVLVRSGFNIIDE